MVRVLGSGRFFYGFFRKAGRCSARIFSLFKLGRLLMDARVLLILGLEALFALWLLYRSGLLNTAPRLALSVLLVAAAFALRALCLDYQTLDYKDFLSHWVAFYREHGGFRSFAYPLGN